MICTKVAYPDRATARQALRHISRDPLRLLSQYRVTGKYPVRSYRCPDCGQWHLTALEAWVEA